MLTLVQASLYTTDSLQKGVIETMAKSNALLEVLPFMEIEGNAYMYNQESKMADVEFRSVNEGYTESSAELAQNTESLVILGGDVNLDRFLIQTKSNINDIKAVQIQLKAKSLAHQYAKTFFLGDTATQAKAFDGLKKRLAGTDQEIAAGGALTLDTLNELLDAVDGGADVLFMSKRTRRRVLALLQSSQHYIEPGQDAFGRPISMYGGVQIRILEDDVLPVDTGVDEERIFAVRLGVLDSVCGLQNGSMSVRDLGEADTKPVDIVRFEWYCGMAMFDPKSAAYVKGITG